MYLFCDDSGKESALDNKVVVIAGYMAPSNDSWTAFDAFWRSQLLRHGISWLHMKDFLGGYGEYKALGWNWETKKKVLEGFIDVIKMTQLIGFGVGVDAEAWRTIVPKEIVKSEGDCQTFCFTRIMNMVTNRMAIAAPRDSVQLSFDSDETYAAPRFQRFLKAREKYQNARRHLDSFAICDPKRYLALQAADLLAWYTRNGMQRKMEGHRPRPEFDRFFGEVMGLVPQYIGEEWDAATLKNNLVEPLLSTNDYQLGTGV